MKLLPRGRRAWVRAIVLFVALAAAVIKFNVHGLGHLALYAPREGDVVFQSLPRGELVDVIEGVTDSALSHCGVVMRDADGRWVVHEAMGVVRETPLYLWIVRGRGARLDVWRWREIEGRDPAALRTALLRYSGKPYDFRYAPGDDEIYCSELVFKAYRDAYGVALGEWEPLGDLNWRPFERFIREMENGALPLGRPMITPVGVTRSPELLKAY